MVRSNTDKGRRREQGRIFCNTRRDAKTECGNKRRTMPPLPGDSALQRNVITVLSSYRLLIALLLLIFFNIELDTRLVGDRLPDLFLIALLAYVMANSCLLVLALLRRLRPSNALLFSAALLDLIALNVFIQASGIHSRPLSLLFIIALVGAAMSLPTQLSMLVAALATLSVLVQAISRVVSYNLPVSELVTAGTLGLVFFITAFAVQRLFSRATRNEILASQRAVDIRELQQLNENIVQRMRTGIVVMDAEGHIQLINESAKGLLGLSVERRDLLSRQIPPSLMDSWQSWCQDPEKMTPTFQATPSSPAIRASFTALSGGESNQSLVFLEDTRQITQQAQAMKLGSLGRLTASIAHEIRNPLGAISHAAQLLAESDNLVDADRRFSEIIQTQSARVNQVVENVLALSRRDNAKPRQFELAEYLQQFIAQYKHSAPHDPHITFRDTEGAIDVTFDTSQLDQVLTNLFDNGLRYSRRATGRATLILRAYIDPTNELPQLDIIDQGPGIAEDLLSKVFEPFYTSESSGDGTGLGLYLAREMCEAHQTQLTYLRTEHNQSCFRLSFAHPKKRWLS